MVGIGLMVIVMGCEVLVQPVSELNTDKVALYVPATAAPGTVITIGLAGNATFVTSTNP